MCGNRFHQDVFNATIYQLLGIAPDLLNLMKKSVWGFIIAGLAVSIVLAVVISPHASTLPDGLEWVAKMKGFLHLGEKWSAWKLSPAPDYHLTGIKSNGVSAALAGLFGTLVVFGLGYFIARIVAKK